MDLSSHLNAIRLFRRIDNSLPNPETEQIGVWIFAIKNCIGIVPLR